MLKYDPEKKGYFVVEGLFTLNWINKPKKKEPFDITAPSRVKGCLI